MLRNRRSIGGECRAELAAALMVALTWAGTPVSPYGESSGRHHRVEVRDLMFQPGELKVAPGDTVTWINHDIVPHTVTASDPGWNSGELAPGERFTLVFEGSGEVRYLCRYHPTMTGALTAR